MAWVATGRPVAIALPIDVNVPPTSSSSRDIVQGPPPSRSATSTKASSWVATTSCSPFGVARVSSRIDRSLRAPDATIDEQARTEDEP